MRRNRITRSANFGPRVGFAWTIDEKGDTVIRGGSGVLFSPQLPAAVRQSAAHRSAVPSPVEQD